MDLSLATGIGLSAAADELELFLQVRGDADGGSEPGGDAVALGGEVRKVRGQVLEVQLLLVP
jgi:hypothetical protein